MTRLRCGSSDSSIAASAETKLVTTAVVSGAAGFIGSHLCERLINRGWDVLGVDNFVTGSRANLTRLEGRIGFRLLQHDVTTPLQVEGPVDYVLHFASPASG